MPYSSRLKKMLFLFLLFFTIRCSAQSENANPIDIDYHACLAKDTSYANVCNCAYTAYDKWDKEMDKAYGKLLKILKKEKDKNVLKESQTAWMAYRDAEFKSYDNMFDLPGAKWCGLRQDGRIDIVRSRAVQFSNYIEVLKKRE